MAIKLRLASKIVPVQIGDFEFEVDLSDEKMSKFNDKRMALLKNLQDIDSEEDKTTVLKEILEDAFTDILGAGSYEKLFEHCGSVNKLAMVLSDLVKAIYEQVSSGTKTDDI